MSVLRGSAEGQAGRICVGGKTRTAASSECSPVAGQQCVCRLNILELFHEPESSGIWKASVETCVLRAALSLTMTLFFRAVFFAGTSEREGSCPLWSLSGWTGPGDQQAEPIAGGIDTRMVEAAAASPEGDRGSRESLSAEVVAELAAAFCRDTGGDNKSAATEKFRHSLITNANNESIAIQSMRLGTQSAVCLSKVLKNHPLSTLDLFGNVVRDVGAIALLQLVRAQPSIKHLNLGSNDLTHESGIAFARDLASLQVQTLEFGSDGSSLYTNRFNHKVGIALADQLCSNSSLTSLGLSGTGIGRCEDKSVDVKQEAAAMLRKALRLSSTLRHLRLARNSLGTQGCVLVLQALADNHSLRELDLSHNNAGAELGVVAGQALAQNASLTTLSLAGNRIGAGGGCALAAALVTNGALTQMNLQQCALLDRGCIAVANALEANRCLMTCVLSENDITQYGGLAWPDTLWSNQSLRSLSLSKNPLGDEVAVNLAGVLSRNKSLTRLELSACKIGDEGALSLVDALEGNTTLTALKLANNVISEAGGMIMADMVEGHGALERLDVRANSISHASQVRMQQACARTKEAARTREPRALAAQMVELKRKEQRIIECEFRISRAAAARAEAEAVLAHESALLAEAQSESRTKLGAAQAELEQVLQAVEEAEKRLEDKQAEKNALTETSAQQLQAIDTQIAAQEEEKVRVTAEMQEAERLLQEVKTRKAQRLAELSGQLEASRAECEALEKEAEATRRHLVGLQEAAEQTRAEEQQRKAAELANTGAKTVVGAAPEKKGDTKGGGEGAGEGAGVGAGEKKGEKKEKKKKK